MSTLKGGVDVKSLDVATGCQNFTKNKCHSGPNVQWTFYVGQNVTWTFPRVDILSRCSQLNPNPDGYMNMRRHVAGSHI